MRLDLHDGQPPIDVPDGWADSEEGALARVRAIYARRDAGRAADAERRAKSIRDAMGRGVSIAVLARAWSVEEHVIGRWAAGGFTGDETSPRHTRDPDPDPDPVVGLVGHRLIPVAPYAVPHFDDCGDTRCPACGCCTHCLPAGCGCEGCTDRDCVCTLDGAG